MRGCPRRGDGIESDVCEEDHARPAEHAAPPELSELAEVGSTQICDRTSVWVPSTLSGAPTSAAGSVTPSSDRNAVKYPDQPTETVAAANRYSRIRSRPMIPARNSPSVA